MKKNIFENKLITLKVFLSSTLILLGLSVGKLFGEVVFVLGFSLLTFCVSSFLLNSAFIVLFKLLEVLSILFWSINYFTINIIKLLILHCFKNTSLCNIFIIIAIEIKNNPDNFIKILINRITLLLLIPKTFIIYKWFTSNKTLSTYLLLISLSKVDIKIINILKNRDTL